MGPKTKSAHLLRWHYGERVTMGQFSNSFPKHFSYLCEYAFICDLSCSFCEYPIIFHCLHCSPSCFYPKFSSPCILLAWAILDWLGFTVFQQTKAFHLQKQAAGHPTATASSRRSQKHSAETTINFSGSKRQHVSAHRQQPRAVHPVRRVRANISTSMTEDGHKEGGRRRKDGASA